MKVSLNWARQFTDVNLSTKELVQLATERLGGVEGYEDISKHYDGIIVAKVVSCVKHSNADKLNVCLVDDGGVTKDVARNKDGYVQVVCGAANVRAGLLVAWIPPSAIVPASYGEKELFVLEARDLRGELSNGMLASPAELGMSDDHSGILEIEEDVQPGTPFKKLYNLDDVIIEVENKMFTHRPDCFGQLGVARELAGIQHYPFVSPDWYLSPRLPGEGNSNISITIEDSKMCPRYMAIEIEGFTVKPSPIWLQSYLKRVGIRPINNVVDITNYIMMETAQPLHAFDFDKIAKNGKANIVVRRPKDGETMTLLNGKQIQPHEDAALICNEDVPIALGGVMGGGDSEVDESTTRILLECATFNMYNVRKTSMIHGIFTDAVTRLNKGQPAAQLPSILGRAIKLFEEVAGAKSLGYVDAYPEKSSDGHTYIEVTAKFINDRLGSKFSEEEIITLLTNVEFEAHVASGPISITAPFWRTDIETPEDIVEEIGRMYGFDQLPKQLPKRSIAPVQAEPKLALKQQIRQTLARAGANEVLAYSFVHGNLLTKVGQKPEDSFAIRNALSPDLQYYRQTLTPGLLELVHSNVKSGFEEFALFELNKAHNKVHGNDEEDLPGELNFIALTYVNSSKKAGSSYFNARRYLDYLAESFGFTLSYTALEEEPGYPVTSPFEYTRSALVTINEVDVFLGIVGEYKQSVVKSLKLPKSSAGFEVGLDALLEAMSKHKQSNYTPLSKYPSTEQDVTLKVGDTVSFAILEACLKTGLSGSEYRWRLKPLGIYQAAHHSKQSGVAVEKNRTSDDAQADENNSKNVTFRITLSHNERTLTMQEVNTLIEKITWRAHEELGAEQI